MIEKMESRVCPECGNPYFKKDIKNVALSNVIAFMTCENGHTWTEFYSMSYIGFTYKGHSYNSYGLPVLKGEGNE